MKNVKKLLAGVAVMAVLVSFGGARAAEAGTYSCPPHGPYVEDLMEISQWYQVHYPTVNLIGYDEYGNVIPLYGSDQKPLTTKCEMTQTRYHIGIYCRGNSGKCNWLVNDYFYEDPIMHTYCSVG